MRFARGLGARSPEKCFINSKIWCVLVGFFYKMVSQENFKKYHFLYKAFFSLHHCIIGHILALAMGYLALGEILENIL